MLFKRFTTLLVAIFVAGILSACASIFPAEERVSAPPVVESFLFNYITEEAVLDSISTRVQRIGRVTAKVQYNLTFEKRGGYINALYVRHRDYVSAGDILASIDTEDLERQIAEQELVVASARVDYANAQRDTAAARDNLERIVANASIDRSNAEREYNGAIALHDVGAISDFDMSKAESTYKSKISDIDKQLTQASNTASIYSDVKAQNSLMIAETRLNNLIDDYAKTKIVSPIDGVVTFAETLNIGSFVEARKTVFTVADNSELVIMITNPTDSKTFYSDFPVGSAVDVRIMGEEFVGFIVFTPADAPYNNVLIDHPYMLVDVPDLPMDRMRPDMTATVNINTEQRNNAIIVSSNAVQRYGEYAYVRVYEDGVSKERPVEVGLITPTKTEIISGLNAGELVIVR